MLRSGFERFVSLFALAPPMLAPAARDAARPRLREPSLPSGGAPRDRDPRGRTPRDGHRRRPAPSDGERGAQAPLLLSCSLRLTGNGGAPLKSNQRTSRETQPRQRKIIGESGSPVIASLPPHLLAPHHRGRYLPAPFLSVTIPDLTSSFQCLKLAIRERGLLRSFPRGRGLALIGN